MLTLSKKKRLYELANELRRRKIKLFAKAVFPEHDLQWFHTLVYDYLQKWIDKDIQKLAIFIPPQHGKSTMSSVVAPAFILGQNPKAKVVCASYTQSKSSEFNRLSQDVIDMPEYRAVFPDTYLPAAGIEMSNELRNSSYFETVGNKGFYKSVGVGGSLTGTTIEYGIIDDPIKDRQAANSPVYRETLWNWYIDVWRTRLNNDSCELMLFTRWHEDDLAGRLFDPNNEHYDEERANQWTVIVLPALKEDADPPIKQAIKIDDPRKVGEALWESFHSANTHEEDKRMNPYTFASLKQQRPSPLEGGMMKREWFDIVNVRELPFNPDTEPVMFMIDGAFTDKVENDPTAIMAYYVYQGIAYVKSCISVRYELNEFLPFARGWLLSMGYDYRSIVRVEYKSSGPGMMSMMGQEQYGGFNMLRIVERHVALGKYTRGEYATPSCAAGKVKLMQGAWNERFVNQVITFPNDVHDDMFDLLCYLVLQELAGAGTKTYKAQVSL